MNQDSVARELKRRLYCWAQATLGREVAEGFPLLHDLQHNRHVRCFLAWMKDMAPAKRLPLCLLLAKRAYEQITLVPHSECDPLAEEAFYQKKDAIDQYHHKLSPTPDADVLSPGFVKANTQKCRDMIIESLQLVFGTPRRCQPKKVWYMRQYGDWVLTTYIEIRRRPPSHDVECYHFLRRMDFDNPTFRDSHDYAVGGMDRIDPLIYFGIAWSAFPLLGRTHEALCAQSVRAVVEAFPANVPKLIEGLEIHP